MDIKLEEVGNIKKGSFILIDGVPCKVLNVTTSAPGKHGAAKARIDAIGLLDGRRRNIVKSTAAKVEVPIIEKKNGQVLSLMGDKAQIMDLDSYEVFDAQIDESVKDKIEEGSQVIYWDMGEVKIIKQIKG